jgi:hypothetical protein
MVKAKLSVDISELRNQLLSKVGSEILPIVQEKIIIDSRDDIIRCFFDALQRNKIFQSLLDDIGGSNRNDVRAHLGLSRELALNAAYEIENMINDSLEFNNLNRASLRKVSGRRGGKFSVLGEALSIGFNISFKKLENNIRSIPSGRYTSEPSGLEIPWIDWLLDGGFVGDYRIAFADDEVVQAISEKLNLKSRSGRAIMLPDSSSDWDIDTDTTFRSGNKNFVIRILEDNKWKMCVKQIILQKIENLGKNINIKVN